MRRSIKCVMEGSLHIMYFEVFSIRQHRCRASSTFFHKLRHRSLLNATERLNKPDQQFLCFSHVQNLINRYSVEAIADFNSRRNNDYVVPVTSMLRCFKSLIIKWISIEFIYIHILQFWCWNLDVSSSNIDDRRESLTYGMFSEKSLNKS